MTLYRCMDCLQPTTMEGDFYSEPRIVVSLHGFRVVKETPCGYWIEGKRWVSKVSKKRFAHPTKTLAVQSFRKRKDRQISILTAQLRQAKTAYEIPEKDFLDCTEILK